MVQFISPLYISLIDLTNTLQIFNYKYTLLMTNMLIIIIGLLVYNYNFIFIIHKIPFISSWAWKSKAKSCIDG